MMSTKGSHRATKYKAVVMDFDAWVRYGYEQGFCSPPVCSTCDDVPTSELEDDAYEELGGRCVHIIRLYSSDHEKEAVELNSPAAVWRASNRGWLPGQPVEMA